MLSKLFILLNRSVIAYVISYYYACYSHSGMFLFQLLFIALIQIIDSFARISSMEFHGFGLGSLE